jgi:UDP-N-acetylglucosamine 2-epimerase (non-hydrolysing)
MIKVITVLGTRPEIIRLSEIIKKCDKYFNHKTIFTNQNFSPELSQIFFKNLKIRNPDYILNIKNESVGSFYGNVLIETEKIFKDEKPDAIQVLGDTNSSICSLIAKRMGIPIFHLEAGNRSFDNNVPEEINRKIADVTSDFNLVYTENARQNLILSGHPPRTVLLIGSPLQEVINVNIKNINKSKILNNLKLKKDSYFLVSIHRQENVDNKNKLNIIISSLRNLQKKYKKKIIISNHPRFAKNNTNLINDKNFTLHKPLGYFDYLKLQINAYCTISDSGTIAEESSILKFKAICIRDSIERPEAIENGCLILSGINEENIMESINVTEKIKKDIVETPNDYKVKNTSTRVIKIIQSLHSLKNRWYNTSN